MSARIYAVCSAVTSLAAGCGGADSPAVELCDGSAGIRAAVQALVPVDRFDQGESVIFDNGSAFFFVSGTCDYYVRWGSGEANNAFVDTTSGHLTDEQADQLVADMGLGHLTGSATYQGGLVDAATLRIWFDGASVVCERGCEGDSIPQWLLDARTATDGAMRRLTATASTPELPQRVVVVTHDQGDASPLYEWPASQDPASIAITPAEAYTLPFGSGVRFDGPDGDALRELRRTVAASPSSPTSIYVWRTRDTQPPEYRTYIRDAIPWEDERDIVTLGE